VTGDVINVPNFGEFAEPRALADLARRAEESGWDGLLVWDHVVEEKIERREIADPWVLRTAAITPVARRRPGELAREVTTLDRLTAGRMVLGVGLGAPVGDEHGSFGDTTDARVLAERSRRAWPRFASWCGSCASAGSAAGWPMGRSTS
jgi:alkanesulfonate monooxygenase SsuD/methylene tetrahydromethanopterin reductase-like flavin-dependent oxidoreductase (luciferase family)